VIALFDSGLGGLSLLREVRAQLPAHDLAYVADSAHCPYGPKPAALVRERSLAIGRALAEGPADALVVACNSAVAAGALEALRAELKIPVIGIEPGIKPAAVQTRTGVVGVLATATTAASDRLASLVERFADDVEVVTQPCPGLVERVEAGFLDGAETRALIDRYVAPLLARGADVLVLGCTHYPFLRALIAEAAPGVEIVDPGPAVARQVARVAAERAIVAGSGAVGYSTTGDPALVEPVLRRLAGDPLAIVAWSAA
jgi:glutamate racemase